MISICSCNCMVNLQVDVDVICHNQFIKITCEISLDFANVHILVFF